jgi:hypothetical protein
LRVSFGLLTQINERKMSLIAVTHFKTSFVDIYYYLQASSSVTTGVSAMNSLSSLMLTRLVPGEQPIVITTKTVNVTINKNLPDRIFNQTLSQGAAACAMPPDWCSVAPANINCSIPMPIAVKVPFDFPIFWLELLSNFHTVTVSVDLLLS